MQSRIGRSSYRLTRVIQQPFLLLQICWIKFNVGDMKAKEKSFVYGVGVYDVEACATLNNLNLASLRWREMLRRCYSPNFLFQNPSYKGCSVCNEWLSFSNFKRWFDNNYVDGYQLDKDILVKGNKIYSPNTCCFVPQEINNLFTKTTIRRGKYPIGVWKRNDNGKFRARNTGKTYNTELEAFYDYKKVKEAYIKEIAEKYFQKNKIQKNVYDSLMNYKVEISD